MSVLQLVLTLRAEEGTCESANDTMASLVTKETASNAAGHRAHETSLAFLWVVWIGWISCVAVRVRWV